MKTSTVIGLGALALFLFRKKAAAVIEEEPDRVLDAAQAAIDHGRQTKIAVDSFGRLAVDDTCEH